MTYLKIRQLLDAMPEDWVPGRTSVWNPGPSADTRMDRFMAAYCTLDFGWQLVTELHQRDLPFPEIVDGADLPLFEAFCHLRGESVPRVDAAIALGTKPSFKRMETEVQVAIITSRVARATEGDEFGDHYLKQAAVELSMSAKTINTYEKLFFNVVDRFRDSKWVRQLIYPESRLVEMQSDYMEQESVRQIMWRSAYNNGLESSLKLLGDSHMRRGTITAREAAERLETELMNQGYFLAVSGLMHSRNATPIQQGRQLIAAAKAGGQETTQDNPLPLMSAALMGQLQTMKRHAQMVREAEMQELQAISAN